MSPESRFPFYTVPQLGMGVVATIRELKTQTWRTRLGDVCAAQTMPGLQSYTMPALYMNTVDNTLTLWVTEGGGLTSTEWSSCLTDYTEHLFSVKNFWWAFIWIWIFSCVGVYNETCNISHLLIYLIPILNLVYPLYLASPLATDKEQIMIRY